MYLDPVIFHLIIMSSCHNMFDTVNSFSQITSADGHSSSGQTPDIAWDKFQKKYCPRVKVWHGNRKRFSCNIDGVEVVYIQINSVQNPIALISI